MLWILRRTGAVNFFNSMNSSYSSKTTSNTKTNSTGTNTTYTISSRKKSHTLFNHEQS